MASLTDLARRLNLALVAVTDERRGGDPLAMAARLPAGSWVIFRHYDAPDRSVLAIKLAALCRKFRLKLFVAGDPKLARTVKAGLHLPDGLAARPTQAIRRWKGPTIAVHDRLGLLRAARSGAQAALLSPVFATASHPGTKPLGLLAFRRLARGAKLPVIALGGIDRTNVSLLKNTPTAGVAAVGAFTSQK